jgi:hypothetical protein
MVQAMAGHKTRTAGTLQRHDERACVTRLLLRDRERRWTCFCGRAPADGNDAVTGRLPETVVPTQ